MKPAAAASSRDAPRQSAGPIFLAGADRSGKTLVRWMLAALPGIAVTRRTDMWPRFYKRYGDLSRPDNFEHCLAAMLHRKHIAALDPDAGRIRNEFRRGAATYPRLFAIVHEQYAERCGKTRWLDQTGLIERYADEILHAYPHARIIHMVRDPRDCCHAVLERGRAARGTVGALTSRWVASARLAQTNARRHRSRYVVVRYEALVAEPEAMMRRLCSFLGEQFRPSMLLLEHAPRYDEQRRTAGGRTPISDAYVGRFRAGLDPAEVAFIQIVAARYMRTFGYVPVSSHLTPSDGLRALATVWPWAVARMGAARVAAHRAARPLALGTVDG